jgi:hypothetical protein
VQQTREGTFVNGASAVASGIGNIVSGALNPLFGIPALIAGIGQVATGGLTALGALASDSPIRKKWLEQTFADAIRESREATS